MTSQSLMQVIYMSDSEDEELEASLVLCRQIPELEPLKNRGTRVPTRVLHVPNLFPWIFCLTLEHHKLLPEMMSSLMSLGEGRCLRQAPSNMGTSMVGQINSAGNV